MLELILAIVNTTFLVMILIAIIFLRPHSTSTEKTTLGKTDEDYQNEIQQVKQKAAEMMEAAVVKAKLILDETKSFKENTEKYSVEHMNLTYETFVNQLNQHSGEIIAEYEKFFAEAQQELRNRETTLLGQIEQASQSRISTVDETIKEEIQKLRLDVKESFLKEMEQANQVIEEYKVSKMKEIDEKVGEQITKLSKQIFAEIIPVDKQKELIFNALENAKKEGVFNV